jgi:hypothetical protein
MLTKAKIALSAAIVLGSSRQGQRVTRRTPHIAATSARRAQPVARHSGTIAWGGTM